MRFLLAILLALTFFPPLLRAADDAANATFVRALELEKTGDARGAAKLFVECAEEADDAALKCNALQAAAAAYGRAGLPEQEFRVIERLLDGYASKVDVSQFVAREFEIGHSYSTGTREPAFWHLRFVPWLTGPDLTAEIYEKALARSPFAPGAATARLRLAYVLVMEEKNTAAIAQLRSLVNDYPGLEARKFGVLALCELYFDLAKRGDGDGRYNREGMLMAEQFLREYPASTDECDKVRKMILRSRDVQAERLLNMARYYERTDRREAASRYLGEVLKLYPDTGSADASEALLTRLDRTYIGERFRPALEPREQSFAFHEFPAEYEPLLLVPENSNGKYLLPIYDLRVGADVAAGKRPTPKHALPPPAEAVKEKK